MCGWHVEQNLKKRTFYLNKGKNKEKQKLFTVIKNLPYSESEDEYREKYNFVKGSSLLDETTKKYLNERHNNRTFWVKCYIKKYFSCGMVSSSRIESKHSILKKYLDNTTRLSELFLTMKALEEAEITNLTKEISKEAKKDYATLDSNDFIKDCRENYSEYIIFKLKEQFLQSINYHVTKSGTKW